MISSLSHLPRLTALQLVPHSCPVNTITSSYSAQPTTSLPTPHLLIPDHAHLTWRPKPETRKFLAGFVSGVIVAGLFNPWDRALYLSVIYERDFLDRANFAQPFKGFSQSLVYRTLSSGLYFPLFDLFEPIYTKALTERVQRKDLLVHFFAGNSAGALSGALLNQFNAIKYASWDADSGFFRTALHMWRQGGYAPFLKGIVPTVVRDTVFGGVFALTKESTARILRRFEVQEAAAVTAASKTADRPSIAPIPRVALRPKASDFTASMVAGALGTVASSPFNFVRNIKYGWSAKEQPPSSFMILKDLYTEIREKSKGGYYAGWIHLQDRLRIGWGTARVAVGMATGYEIYELVKRLLDQQHQQHT